MTRNPIIVYCPVRYGWATYQEGTEIGPLFTTRALAEAYAASRWPTKYERDDVTIEEWPILDAQPFGCVSDS